MILCNYCGFSLLLILSRLLTTVACVVASREWHLYLFFLVTVVSGKNHVAIEKKTILFYTRKMKFLALQHFEKRLTRKLILACDGFWCPLCGQPMAKIFLQLLRVTRRRKTSLFNIWKQNRWAITTPLLTSISNDEFLLFLLTYRLLMYVSEWTNDSFTAKN